MHKKLSLTKGQEHFKQNTPTTVMMSMEKHQNIEKVTMTVIYGVLSKRIKEY